ncbi:MAG: tRNA (adenosine(37)-N6)-threonylcarbamoyltransferase complex transferase subunit TsaD [Wolbachia endosymbiont of Menacanthus eurysternus]|nr:MAG: tRNA (adenosine(37)-N6)-threonylcarbamoyltransferase complex transferase subunit TsaD [Wolbachia endosymbiont of Menacanthus eurysternus]
MKTVLAIETSCDETATAIVNSNKQILAHEVISQVEHKKYGGVVPEIASRAHMEYLSNLIKSSMRKSNLDFCDMDAIASTSGPGLIGGLIVGTMTAKAIAHVIQKPFIAINHLEAHILVIRLIYKIKFPFLVLLISGGHCQFLITQDVGKHIKIGESLDDSLGETFDKIARMLGLGYPGGPIIEKLAKRGDDTKFKLPRAMKNHLGCNFSFSGIKTAVKTLVQSFKMNEQDIQDMCASFQKCISDILLDRVKNAIIIATSLNIKINDFVVTGGVAANKYLRKSLKRHINLNVFFPPKNLCTDNAIMVGWTGIEKLQKGHIDPLNFMPKPKWELGICVKKELY